MNSSSGVGIPRKPVACTKPDYGRRLLPTLIDERAANRHPRPYASVPISNDPQDGFRDISYQQFANAINRCARWIIDTIGTSTSFEVLAYMGPQDLRYQLICIAANKTGHVAFFPSPRNSLDAHLALLDETKTAFLIAPTEEPPAIPTILKQRRIKKLTIPDLNTLLDETPVEAVRYNKTYEQARTDPFLILHTSGSTGLPKAITTRHGYTTSMDAYNRWEGGSELAKSVGNRRVFNPFPLFHMAGIMWALPIVNWVDSTIVFPPPIPLTATLAESMIKHANVQYSALMPSIIIELAKNEESLQRLGTLETLGFAGGPLPKETGDKVSRVTTLRASYGSTEMMAPPVRPKKAEYWQYLHFDTEKSGIEFRRTDPGASTFELVIVRKDELRLEQAIFTTFPDLDEYHTKDVFTRHPTEPNHWLYVSRIDDIIVLSSGEKFNPVTMEGAITSGCSEVSGCLVVGSGQFQTALLIEAKQPPGTAEEKASLTERIWPVVERANQSAVKQGRIAKGFILFTSIDKPLPRAAKGTIQRSKAVSMYQDEIEAFYNASTAPSTAAKQTSRMDLTSVEAAQRSIQRHMQEELGLEELEVDEDLFKHGIDSLQTLSLVRAINESLGVSHDKIEAKQVYENPTVRKLAQSLHSGPILRREDDDDLDTWIEMQQMFMDLGSKLGAFRPKSSSRPPRLELNNSVEWPHSSISESTKIEDIGHPQSEKDPAALEHDSYDASKDADFLISMLPPDGGRKAWMQVLASFLINFNTFGLVSSFGDYQAYYQAHFLSSYSPSAISWIGTVQAALLLIVGALSGPIFDKGYFLVTLRIASLVLVFAWMMLSLSDRYYSIFLTQGILTWICVGLLYIPSVALIPLYFKDRRGLALGLALSGASVGAVIYSIVSRALLASIGFGWATRVVGFVALATLAAASFIIRPLDQIKKPTREFFEPRAFRELPFTFFVLAAFLLYCAWLVPYFLTPSYAVALGTSADTATYLIAVLNAAQLFGRIIPSGLSDYYGGEGFLFAAQIISGILGLSWITINTVGGFVEFQIFYGFVSGMVATLPAVVMPYVCPSLAVLGTRMGMVYAAAGVGILIGNPVALAATNAGKGRTGFLGAQLWMGLCSLVGAGFFIVTAVAAHKQRIAVDSVKDKPVLSRDWAGLYVQEANGARVRPGVSQSR